VKRREFIALLGGTAAAWPFAARAQQRPVVGLLAVSSKTTGARYYGAFPQGLRELGYSEGRDYAFEERYADGDVARLPRLAEELVRLKPRVIVAGATPAVLAARRATGSVPIVGVNMNDPVALGLIASEARPGANVTGVLSRVPGQAAKQLEIARDAVPGASKVGILINADNPSNVLQWRETELAAKELGLGLAAVEIRAMNELGSAVERFVNERVDVVVVLGDAALLTVRRQVAAFALASRLPTVFSFREHVEDGGLVSYGVNVRENYRRAAYFADRILKGEKPADLPVEFPPKVELIVNLATAKALRLNIPPTLLARADEVIE
jgi:ABC-type uncharacterized transport system substrate-binding protein